MTTAIEGITHLLGADANGREWVSRYTDNEMRELFTDENRRQLAEGETVLVGGGAGHTRWTDMVAAARVVAAG